MKRNVDDLYAVFLCHCQYFFWCHNVLHKMDKALNELSETIAIC
jgi:hypothetical protein